MSLSLSLTLSDPLICTFLLGKNPDEGGRLSGKCKIRRGDLTLRIILALIIYILLYLIVFLLSMAKMEWRWFLRKS